MGLIVPKWHPGRNGCVHERSEISSVDLQCNETKKCREEVQGRIHKRINEQKRQEHQQHSDPCVGSQWPIRLINATIALLPINNHAYLNRKNKLSDAFSCVTPPVTRDNRVKKNGVENRRCS